MKIKIQEKKRRRSRSRSAATLKKNIRPVLVLIRCLSCQYVCTKEIYLFLINF